MHVKTTTEGRMNRGDRRSIQLYREHRGIIVELDDVALTLDRRVKSYHVPFQASSSASPIPRFL